ncbi:response regulator [Fontisphaera persica]|uniref:response regulator n=1 Tax=Fontisphaera persica TaxID=2974023 RepID=UPI0024C081C2|nr:response regulator [Fontisphaera persica]WCJ58686.1 response regulator [Fontisphaera persica]
MKSSTSDQPGVARPTVLVVDDQVEVLAALQLMLNMRGYEVLAAAGGTEALRVVQEHPGKVEVVVTDYAMPEMNGLQLIERLRVVEPALQFVAISGNASPAEVASLVAAGVVEFLAKPFSVEALHQAIQRAVDLRRQGLLAVPTAASS